MKNKKKENDFENEVNSIKIEIENEENNISDENDKNSDNQDNSDNSELIASLNSKYDELNDRYLRLYSEFDNYRKRTNKEKIELREIASESLIKDLLPILDDLDRSIETMKKSDNIESILEGITIIINKLKGVLANRGLKEIDTFQTKFDTDYHEAVTTIPTDDDSLKGKVIEQIQKGYMLNDKVIRFSKVIVGE